MTIRLRSTALAMVPPRPKELTVPSARPIIIGAAICNGSRGICEPLPEAAQTCSESTSNCAFGAACTWHRVHNSFASPIIPDADSVCPTLALTLPASNAPDRACCQSRADDMAPTSIASPSAEPFAAASAYCSSTGEMSASLRTAMSSICCARPLGAVRLALRPSWHTVLPVTSAGA